MSETKNRSNPIDDSAMSSRIFYSNTSATNGASSEAGPSKRQAMKGQWQTPPIGEFFPSVAPTTNGNINLPVRDLPVPSTSDDYARALQEAYRRGAEAAAALSQTRSVSSSVTSPIFSPSSTGLSTSKNSNLPLSAQTVPSSSNMANVLPSSVPSAPTAAASASTTGATNMGVPTPIPFLNANATSQTTAAPLGVHTSPLANANAPTTSRSPSVSQPMASYVSTQPQSVRTMQVEPTSVLSDSTQSTSGNIHFTNQPQPVLNSLGSNRSMSMPDMSSLENKVEDEEAKRLKRLARNRASARLRRLRKKTLVESYETEVGVLESSLAKLKAHKWGVGGDATAVLEALSMDRGQQKIDSEKRKELITSILGQQREQIRSLMDCQLETMILGRIAHYNEQGGESNGDDSTDLKLMDLLHDNDDLDSLSAELNEILNLTTEQKEKLRNSTSGIEEERKAIAVIDESLLALMSNSWLLNNGIEQCTDQFIEILNPTQVSKFLLWADHNSEAIDQLDYVNAPPANSAPNASPMFIFGVDEMNNVEDG
mmetsp:Transcript_2408/g.4469  ORF Transcript_2408/g.4469 Transcript_2408/m.4469 type:complete len:541 (+) Transcript_2408:463-2085(+)|eukprot:CAMPEP_0176478414 /NCGR_PEP_ID=MMETSP0200_2-20121128/1174_1 /TAXON_ID=947934 /ORGANISM="Chaetoceros sp., Strain GSL56" /LENGTH=540 /DNA_ID=CAMNT_0017874351 /DNA_START=375 /DNA_END=1997 /DNA_ORIENTATION=+